jgi:cytochrome P450
MDIAHQHLIPPRSVSRLTSVWRGESGRVQSRIHQELHAAGLLHLHPNDTGSRDLAPADVGGLLYLERVLREGLRLHPAAAGGSVRITTRAMQMGPYLVPKGSGVWAPPSALHRSVFNYIDPDRFWPERWEHECRPEDEVRGF